MPHSHSLNVSFFNPALIKQDHFPSAPLYQLVRDLFMYKQRTECHLKLIHTRVRLKVVKRDTIHVRSIKRTCYAANRKNCF